MRTPPAPKSRNVPAGATLALLAGCAAVQHDSAPRIEVPAAWVASQADAADNASAAPTGPASATVASAVTRDWFHSFGSPELDSLVSGAYASSFDLQAAEARLRQADARARAAGAALLPQVNLEASSTSHVGHSSSGTLHETDYGALLAASYEVDFWGRNRAARTSAQALRNASRADRDVVALSMVTGVANTYFMIVSLRERQQLAEAAVRNTQEVLAIVAARRAVGLANPADVAQQRAVVAAAGIRAGDLGKQQLEAQAALAILLGRNPGELGVRSQRLVEFQEPQVAAGLPSQLLTRRPDLYQAEENLRAARADLAQARAAFLPSITLTASGGVQSPAVQAAVLTLSGAGPSLTAGAALVQAIFAGGRLRAARDAAKAKEEEMIASYRAAVLASLWDTQSALMTLGALDRQDAAQRDSLAQSEIALSAARARYQQGAGEFQPVLDAERSWLAAQEQMSQYRLARLQAQVSLCKALGGGWVAGN